MTATASRVERDLDEIRRLAAEGAALVGEQGTGAGPDAYEQASRPPARPSAGPPRPSGRTCRRQLAWATRCSSTWPVRRSPAPTCSSSTPGYHFAETLGTRDAYAATLPIRMRTVLPLQTVAEQDAEYGPKLHDRDPDQCCALRKVEPLERGLVHPPRVGHRHAARGRPDPHRHRGRRRGTTSAARSSSTRWPPGPPRTSSATREENGVFNPLRQIGYASIGCAPCTRAVADGEDPRAGRWSGRAKTECGLHT